MTWGRLLPYGPGAVLAEYDSLDQVIAVADRIGEIAPAWVVDVVPAARTVLVTHRADVDRQLLRQLLTAPVNTGRVRPKAPKVEIAVRYDGIDLDTVAVACGLSVDEVIERHCGATYTVAFCGFMPGFSYLVGLDPLLTMPRRPTPRIRVDAGSVAIAAEFSAVYPAPSPGGWHVLGHTDAVMWDDSRAGPALLPPGSNVRFAAS